MPRGDCLGELFGQQRWEVRRDECLLDAVDDWTGDVACPHDRVGLVTVEPARLFLNFLMNGEATLLDADGRHDRWHLRVLYPDREHFAGPYELATENGLTFDIKSIRELEGEPAGRYGLSDEQYRALVLAFERGYFEVPRKADLSDLAKKLDISHQALSERLRRGTGALVEATLVIGALADEE